MEAPLNAVIGVVAHPARRDAALELADEVEAQYLSFDQWGQGERWNHRHVIEVCAMIAEKEGREWIVVLEDDAVPCDGFREKLASVLDDASGAIGSLYLGTGRWAGQNHRAFEARVADEIEAADELGEFTDIMMPGLYHAVAVVLHVGIVKAVLDAFDRSKMPSDQAITDAALHERIEVWYTHPSLVDHRDGEPVERHPDGEPRTEKRHAWSFAGRAGWRDADA